MARYAIVKTDEIPNVVINTHEWDGNVGNWQPPPNRIAVQSDEAGIGWTWNGTVFAPPPPGPPPVQYFTDDELEALADAVTSLAEAKQVLRKFARALGRRIPKP